MEVFLGLCTVLGVRLDSGVFVFLVFLVCFGI